VDKNKAEAEVLANLGAAKHARRMAEHAQHMAKLELKKQWIDVEASEKQMQAEDHQTTAKHQWECEKEVHDLQMLCLCIQYQGTSTAAGMGQFGMTQFAGPETFKGVGTDNFGGVAGGDTFGGQGLPTFDRAVPSNDFGILPHFNG